MIRKKGLPASQYCCSQSVHSWIGKFWFIPGEKGAPPGNAITVGLAAPSGRQIMEQFCLPRSRVFVDHFARSRFVFVGLLVIPGLASKLLPKDKRLVGEPPGAMGCVCGLWRQSWPCASFGIHQQKTCRCQLCRQVQSEYKKRQSRWASLVFVFVCFLNSFPVNLLAVCNALSAFGMVRCWVRVRSMIAV